MLGGVAQFKFLYFHLADAAYLCAAISMEESGEESTVVFS
jgi:hypothetical protein